MKHNYYPVKPACGLRAAALAAAMTLSATLSAQTTPPQKPVNFKADANYNKVVLTWENPVETETLLAEDFEGSSFPSEGWSQTVTNTYDPTHTWFQFPSAEMEEDGIDDESRAMFVHGGKKSALVYFDMYAPHDDGSSAAQNEWLIMPATKGAEYLTFYSYINPELLTYSAEESFPDHYYVKVSHDGGNTWTVVWDARTDMMDIDAFQKVSLYLGDPSQGDPIVAFQATGDPEVTETGLYFAWAIDDVELSKRAGSATAAPTEAYNVYYDGEPIAENLHATTYTDLSDKVPGEHTYAVEAVSTTVGLQSEKVEQKVTIKNPVTNAPTNVKLSYKEGSTKGKYDVTVTWDAPEGDRKPVNYSVYCNNALVAGYMEEMEVEQTGKPKGAYTYQVVANYEYPSGASDRTLAEANIAIGTRFPATNLDAKYGEGNTLAMTWQAPVASEYELDKYDVYRGNTKIGETKETTFTEQNAPDGYYDYAVKAVYADGVAAIPAVVNMAKGQVPSYQLPFTEDFTGGLTPENWTIEKVDGKVQDQYLWRFNNLFDIPVEGGNFSGDFASVSSAVAGYTNVWTVLDTPPLVRGALKDGEKTFLEFDVDYDATTTKTSEAGVYYSLNAQEWAPLEIFNGYVKEALAEGETCKPEHKVIDITDCFTDDATPIYIAWSYKGKLAQHLAIDNVCVYNGTAAAIRGIGDNAQWRIDGHSIILGGNEGTASVFTADGIRLGEALLNGSQTSLPLAAGMNIITITTPNGTKMIKISL